MILKKGLSDKTDTNTKGSSPNIASNMKQIYAKRLTAVSPEMISEEIELINSLNMRTEIWRRSRSDSRIPRCMVWGLK